MTGTALALSVYYLFYGGEFVEGEAESSPLTLVGRVVAVALLVVALRPIRLRVDSTLALTALYCLALLSFLMALVVFGRTNDTFFLNTVLQLPVLVALAGTRLNIDYGRWLRFIALFVAVEAVIDIVIATTGSALWMSGAFVGGVGNPSSFGLICALMCAFCLFHPQAWRWRRSLAVGFAAAAIMTKSLFAVFAVALIWGIWATRNWRRFAAIVMLSAAAAISIYYFALGLFGDDEAGFVANKLYAVGALLGFVSYDANSSQSVDGRLEIHLRTFDGLREEPWRLLLGHLGGQVYWPMDSQLLTYLGSFGIIILLAFLLIHLIWTRRALLSAQSDGGFSFIALLLFSLIFFTNRILDYFPIASIYFICVMSCSSGKHALHVQRSLALTSEKAA